MIRLLRLLLPLMLGAWSALAAFPQITGYSPFRGAPGTVVVISGNNFGGLTDVFFNNTKATVQSASATQIRAIVPGDALSGPISVWTTGGQDSTQLFNIPNFQVAPRITVVYRELDIFDQPVLPAKATVGDTIYIRGANLDDPNFAPANGLGIFINGVRVTQGSVNASSLLQITVPSGAGTGPVTVTNFAGAATTTQLLYFQPQVSAVVPPRAKIGDTIEVRGVNFTGVTEVRFGTLPAASFTVLSNTNLTAVVPANAVNGSITVTAPGGSYITVGTFLVLPNITSFTPAGGPPGTVVTLDGTALSGTTSIKFGNTAADKITNVSPTRVTTVVPASATTGPITLVTGNGTNVTAASFFLAPTVSAFTPIQGNPGTVVKLTGQNFTGTTKVEFSSVNAPQFTVDSATQITVTVPEGALTGFIKVTNPGGSDESTLTFRILGNEPQVSGFSPKFGPAGTQVTLTGVNLANVTNVTFNGTKATFTAAQETSLVATVPAGATTGPIVVTSPDGSGSTGEDFVVGSNTDLRTTLTVSANPAIAHGPLTYNLRVVNQGILPATNTVVRVTLPAGVSYFDATATRPFVLNGNVFQVNAGTMNADDILTGLIRVMVGAPGDITTTATATSPVADATPANNNVTLNLVAQAPELLLELELPASLRFSWSAAGTNYVAEQSPQLNAGNWQPLPGTPDDDGSTLQLTVPVPDGNRFYRVRLKDGL